jgi:ribosomal protein S12 methylthiotransferase accessory factor
LRFPLDPAVPKQYRAGTHRSRAAADTVERVGRLAGPLGITRVADVTGLDAIGIPVVMVSRPNARSLSVSQGKGVTLDAAKASGLMESLELFHAERISLPVRFASHEQLRFTAPVVDLTRFPRHEGSRFDEHTRTLWVEGADLLSGGTAWLPLELIHLDCTRPELPGHGVFIGTSNGLASGNDRWEAVIHGICEILERDGQGRLGALPDAEQDARRIRLASVTDADAVGLLERYDRAGVTVAVWDSTGPAGIASFLAGILVERDWSDGGTRIYYGMGCHPDRDIALCRALTEAAQTRLTMIIGSRDDAGRALYHRAADADRAARERHRIDRAVPSRDLAAVPTFSSDDLAEDGRWVLHRAAAGGFGQVLAVDLTMDALGIPVVSIVIPAARTMGPWLA